MQVNLSVLFFYHSTHCSLFSSLWKFVSLLYLNKMRRVHQHQSTLSWNGDLKNSSHLVVIDVLFSLPTRIWVRLRKHLLMSVMYVFLSRPKSSFRSPMMGQSVEQHNAPVNTVRNDLFNAVIFSV